MSNDKAYLTMQDLVSALQKAEEDLRSGNLVKGDLDTACENAREFYERLVVLRHKAREGSVAKEPSAPPVKAEKPKEVEQPKASVPTPAPAPPPAPAPDQPVIRLDTRPSEAPRQTTLIEAIEDNEKDDTPMAKTASEYLKEAAAAKAVPSIAEKMEHSRISDLAKAISLSDKFWFTKELFSGDKGAYEQSIALLNSADSMEDARTYLDGEVLSKLKKPADGDALTSFSELLQRRFA
ncbi:MAG: hypothetical protein IPI81_12870 [Flavobacteriales bacterium]|nr:hypothetical protein [Flavobacteriales bacterium]MCC6937991.1 hypothetical protein [Flavobacteriales bacterium]